MAPAFLPLPRVPAVRRAALVAFRHFRKAWGPRAAYVLTRVRFAPDPAAAMASVLWLIRNRVPLSGSAPSMNFAGLPYTGRPRVTPAPAPFQN